MYPVAIFIKDRIRVEPGQEASLISIKVYSFSPGKSKELIQAIQSVLLEDYEAKSRKYIEGAQAVLLSSVENNKNKLKQIYQKMSSYKSVDQIVPVTLTAKKNLDNLGIAQALELELMLVDLKKQLEMLNMSESQKRFVLMDDVLFKMFFNKLTDMEFKKLLIPNDFRAEYEEGLRKTKTRLVAIANEFAQRNAVNQGDINLFIRFVFLKSRFDSLEKALNKQYAVVETLSGQQRDYAGLKQESDQAALALENILVSKELMTRVLEKRLSSDITVDTPVIIIKK